MLGLEGEQPETVDTTTAPLRTGTPPVLGRVERGRLLLDLLAVAPDDDDVVAEAVRRAAAGTGALRPQAG